jgi:hypothetical protein
MHINNYSHSGKVSRQRKPLYILCLQGVGHQTLDIPTHFFTAELIDLWNNQLDIRPRCRAGKTAGTTDIGDDYVKQPQFMHITAFVVRTPSDNKGVVSSPHASKHSLRKPNGFVNQDHKVSRYAMVPHLISLFGIRLCC